MIRHFIQLCACLLLPWFLAGEARAIIGVSVQMQLGNPSGATSDPNNHQHYLTQRTVEALDYNDTLGQPNWASWDLTASDIGTNARSSFTTDPSLPPDFYPISPDDYTYSGYDRGHLCPSKDRTATAEDNDLVFLISNVLPQAPVNNSGVWLQFENYCRALVLSSNNYELLILCGPSGYSGTRLNTNGYEAIPDYVWKIAVVVPPGGGLATSRITTTNRVIAIKVPNTDDATNHWEDYVTSANQIQVDTGLNFFTALPAEVAASLRAKVDGQTNPPPDLFAFSPASGEAGTSIGLTGTNFLGAMAVTFNGVNAAFTLDSATYLTAVVPTNAGSGFISVTTPSGTAISTNSFTVLNQGGSVYSGVLAGWDVSTLPGGTGNYGPSPYAATSQGDHLAVEGLTRGSAVKTTGTAATGGWGGVGFTNVSASAAGSNQFISFSVMATNGYAVSFSSLNRFDYYRSGTGPTDGELQYQIGTGPFTTITNLAYPTDSSGASIGAINLSSIAALQGVGANTNVTFRIVNWNGGGAGTWYIYNAAGTTALDLAVSGTVQQIVDPANPPGPMLAIRAGAGAQFNISVTGEAGTNYVLQAATNLTAPVWVPVVTNASPFTWVETNAATFGMRFYRALAAP